MIQFILCEIRKNFLRRNVIVAFIILLCFNVIYIYLNFKTGDTGFSKAINQNAVSDERWSSYISLHDKLDGKITTEKVQYIVDKYNELYKEISDKSYSTNYDKDTMTGYIYGDYSLVNEYFYQPLKYEASYQKNIMKLVKEAKENIQFYTKYKNNIEVQKNQYFIKKYSNRKINVFYETQTWKKLFEYRLSDLFIFFIILLSVVPVFRNEKDIGMYQLIVTARDGKKSAQIGKYVGTVFFNSLVVILFALVNILCYSFTYGLSGFHMPLYALESYEYTSLNASVIQFYVLLTILKVLSFSIAAIQVCFISAHCNKIVTGFIVGFLVLTGELFISGYYGATKIYHLVMAVLCPLTLLKSSEIYKNISGMNILDNYVPIGKICIIVQAFYFIVSMLICFIHSGIWKRNVEYMKGRHGYEF